jgi:polyphosphate glucokinase
VLGGGNAKKLKELPPLCRLGDNMNAFEGGFRLWQGPHSVMNVSSRMQPASPEAAR